MMELGKKIFSVALLGGCGAVQGGFCCCAPPSCGCVNPKCPFFILGLEIELTLTPSFFGAQK